MPTLTATPAAPATRVCEVCSEPLPPGSRRHARTCSTACRMVAYRKRNAPQSALETHQATTAPTPAITHPTADRSMHPPLSRRREAVSTRHPAVGREPYLVPGKRGQPAMERRELVLMDNSTVTLERRAGSRDQWRLLP